METTIPTWIVHLIRNSLAFTGWKDRKTIVPWIRAIYLTETEELAFPARRVRGRVGKALSAIGQAWRWNWDYVVSFFGFPPPIRKMIYTTNAVERSLRKIIKTRGSFPTDEPTIKLLLPGHPERRRPMAKSY